MAIFISGEVANVASEIGRHEGIMRTWYAILRGTADVGAGAAVLSLAATEIVRYFMVLAHSFQKWVDKKIKQRVAKAHEKGREEGVAEGEAKGVDKGREQERQLWTEWLARREEAEARGEEFTLPPPNGKV